MQKSIKTVLTLELICEFWGCLIWSFLTLNWILKPCCSFLVVLVAERLKSFGKIFENFYLGADNNSEESSLEEALRRESETVLVQQKLVAKVNIIFKSLKLIHLNSNHHIHSRTWFYWRHTPNVFDKVIRCAWRSQKFAFHVIHVRFWDSFEDFRQRRLNKRVWM